MNHLTLVYSCLLKAYPMTYREEYAEAMIDVFEQEYMARAYEQNVLSKLKFWLFIIQDVIMTVPKQHLVNLKRSFSPTIYLIVPALCLGVSLGSVGLSQTDIGVVAGLLLLSSFVFGFLGKRKPWLWGISLGIFIPLVGLAAAFFHIRVSGRERNQVIYWYTTYKEAGQMMLSLAFTFLGAYTGYGLRKLISLSGKEQAGI